MTFEIKQTGISPHHIADAIIDALHLQISRESLASHIPSPQHAASLSSVVKKLQEFRENLHTEDRDKASRLLIELIERASEQNYSPKRTDIPVPEYHKTIEHFIDAASLIFHEPNYIARENALSFIGFIKSKHYQDRNTAFYPSYKDAIKNFGHESPERFKFISAIYNTINEHRAWLQPDDAALRRSLDFIFSVNVYGRTIREGFNTFSNQHYGIGDFVTLCQATTASPIALNHLTWIARSVPSLDPTLFSKNRYDALFFDEHFLAIRKAIHYQVPHAHELLGCIIAHYNERTEDTRRALDRMIKIQPTSIQAPLIASLTDERINLLNQTHSTGGDMTGIQMARQLFEQTKPVKETPPITTDEILNTAMQQMHTYGTQIPLQELQSSVTAINSVLAGLIINETHGINPSLIGGLLWTERAIVQRLQTISFEEQEALPFSELFAEILDYHYLTSSAEPYSKEAMEHRFASIALYRSSPERMKEACHQMLLNAANLAQVYRKEGEPFWADSLISGNLVDVFVDLLSPREAYTAIGQRIRRERIGQQHPVD